MNNAFPDLQPQSKGDQVVKTPFRIGAAMLFVSAIHGIFSSVLFLILNGWKSLGFENIVISIINIVIGVMLWQGSVQAAVRWAVITILYSVYRLFLGDSCNFIVDIAFGGSLILLLAGKPSKVRTIASIVVFVVVYLGLLCLGFTSYFILGVR